MSNTPERWPSKTPSEIYLNGLDWSLNMETATLGAVSAEVIEGTVTITTPQASFVAEGTLQMVWVSGGTPGRQQVRLTANFSDGRRLTQDFAFIVCE